MWRALLCVARGFETLNVSFRYALGNDLCCCEFSASIGRGCLEANSFCSLVRGPVESWRINRIPVQRPFHPFVVWCNSYSLFPFALQSYNIPRWHWTSLWMKCFVVSVVSCARLNQFLVTPLGLLLTFRTQQSITRFNGAVDLWSKAHPHGPSDFTALILIFKQFNYFNCFQAHNQIHS